MILGCCTDDMIWISLRIRMRSASVSILDFLMVLMATLNKNWFTKVYSDSLTYVYVTGTESVHQHVSRDGQKIFVPLHISQRQILSYFFVKKSGVSKVNFNRFYKVKTNFIRNLLIKPIKINFWYSTFLMKKLPR